MVLRWLYVNERASVWNNEFQWLNAIMSTEQNAYHLRDEKKKTNFFWQSICFCLLVCLLVSVLKVDVYGCVCVCSVWILHLLYLQLLIYVFHLYTNKKRKHSFAMRTIFVLPVGCCYLYHIIAKPHKFFFIIGF